MAAIYVTEAGKLALERLIRDKEDEIKRIRAEKNTAYEVSGDGWHDNPGFNRLTLQEEQAVRELRALEARVAAALVLPPAPPSRDCVKIGSIVRACITPRGNGEPRLVTFEIVGSGESDLLNNRVSYDSPLGNALLGLGPDEERAAVIPKGPITVKVLQLLGSWSEA